MKRAISVFLLFFVSIMPVAASAASLDDYYLSRLAPAYSSGARIMSGIVAGQSPLADRSQTGVRHDAWLDWKKLQPTTQKILAKVLSRPALTGEKTCTPVGGHFTIHYATSGQNAPDPTDVNQNGVPDWVETVAGIFEYVYNVEVTTMGYKAPPVAVYDIYLEDLASQSVYGYTTNDTPVTSTSYTSYIEVDKSFTSPVFGAYTPLTSLRITAAHEFNHAIQYGYNAYFQTSFAEMTSTWMEDEVYDSGNQLYSYISWYLPVAGTVSIDSDGNTDYGRWMFNRYLTELQGNRSVIRSIWEELAKIPAPTTPRSSPDDGVEIPMLPVIDSAGVLNGNLGNNFFGFTKRLLVRDWLSHQTDIPRFPYVTLAGTYSASGAVQAPINSLATPYTFVFYEYTPSTLDGQPLVINFPSLSPALAVSAFKKDDLGWHEYAYVSASQSITVPAFTTDAVVYLIVCNNANGDMRDPVVISPPFAADASLVTDGSQLDSNGIVLDANRLVIPPVPVTKSSKGGGGCFIATAAYGSYMHPKVAELREFRDRYLLTNAPGRLFVALYYRLSPPIASVIAQHAWMRACVRVGLTPVVLAVENPVEALLVLLLSGGGVVWWLTRRYRFAQLAKGSC